MEELNLFIEHYAKGATIEALRKELDAGRSVNLQGMAGSSIASVLASLSGSSAPLVCVMDDPDAAGYLYADLGALFGEGRVLFFPSSYKRAIKYGHIDPACEVLRAEVLAFLVGKGDCQNTAPNGAPLPIIVTYPSALLELVVDKDRLGKDIYTLKTGDHCSQEFLRELLLEWGFTRTDYVYEPGQFAIRGSIMDIFSYAREYPYRVDFFGDEVESIRFFEIESQLSVETVSELRLMPDVGALSAVSTSVLELLPQDSVFLLHSYSYLSDRVDQIYSDAPLMDDGEGFASIEDMQQRLTQPDHFRKLLSSFVQIRLSKEAALPQARTFVMNIDPQPPLHKNFELLIEMLECWRKEGFSTYFSTNNRLQAERISEILTERGAEDLLPIHLPITLHEGFIDKDNGVVLLTDHQIFDRYHKYNLKSDNVRSGKVTLSLKELNQFSAGDLIVHVDHGIGLFGGLIHVEEGGVRKEVIKLIYQNDDVVFVSLHSLHKLSKYHGKSSENVRLSKVGSGAWQKLKDRTKKHVKDIARDLIRLYAARREVKGYAYSPDSSLQHELEASFQYEDTPDQAKATAEVKRDMERPYPMDRLICGDVGFGKTEIALRAAFKAACDNKQVAVLVPTTVLAYQHYTTFTRRFKEMPVRVEYLSRARSTQQTKAILTDLAEGRIDVIIGTHRLVSKDIRFKDLGLLIIDEEQKFGVTVKEKLRKLQLNVDTLTMSATPIPRTLHFSLMGARDLSNINTPPPNRYPVETALVRFGPDIIREAINFEMSRSGQIFFVHNRIQNIEEIAAIIHREVPDARVAVAHGQMKPAELEEILMDFNRHEYDVLLSTTIVENGIDVSNANTILINDAHRYGLSDLHQLRGRVGRGQRKAFCYLISPPLSSLTEEASRRLQAIESFSDLGSGIRIALQDLDIRGAGNALGAEQSGFVADLGYEAYQKVFDEALTELKVDEFSDFFGTDDRGDKLQTAEAYVTETQVETNLQLYFAADYIPQDGERILLYRELDSLNTDEELAAFEQKLIDRFGPIPDEGKQLISVPRLRRIGRRLGIEKIVLAQGKMSLHLIANEASPYYSSPAFAKLLAYATLHNRKVEFKQNRQRRILSIRGILTVDNAIDKLREIEQMSTEGIG
ncbi:MAG: transcription-repair coupling factor [Porphyromonas sp.]|nr:transcription-repair coupling factor [Porphyromonas sp.]